MEVRRKKKLSQDELLTIIIESLNHPFYLINAHNHQIELANTASRSAIGMPCFTAIHGFDVSCNRHGIECPLEKVKKTGKPVKVEHIHTKKDGKRQFFEIHAYPIRDKQGNIEKIIEYSFDITVQRELEEKLKKSYQEVLSHKEKAELANRMKSQFLANMSHDIRTPLHGILGFADLLLKRHSLPEKAKDYVDKIKKSGEGLLTLLNDILDYSKIEAGQLDIHPQDFLLHELFDNMRLIFKPQAKEKGLELELFINDHVPERIHNDRWRLHQVVENLLSNAVKFTTSGTISLTASYKKKEDSLLLAVEDTGCGIPERYLRIIFNPFTQIRFNESVEKKGTGLGLTISKNLVSLLGGTLHVESTPGKGSQFTIEIPVNSGKVSGENQPHFLKSEKGITHSALKGAWRSAKILIAEDNPVNLELMLEQLKYKGLRKLWTATNGKEAIEQVSLHAPDLILMDIQMPVVDGYRAIKELRSQGYEQPIIAFTAYTMRDEVEKCMEAGATAVFTKPVDFNKFFQELAQYIRKDEKQTKGVQMETDYSFIRETISQRVRQVFLEDARIKLETLEKFLSGEENGPELEDIRKIAHNYKGNAGYLGLDTLAVVATSLDTQVKNNDPPVVIRHSVSRMVELIKKIISVNFPDQDIQ